MASQPKALKSSFNPWSHDTNTVFSHAKRGLDVLIRQDPRFSDFKRVLFSEESKIFDRAVEVNDRINGSIASYLKLLSEYFISRDAQKTLAYLFRIYEIHVYNIDDLILCSLPHSESRLFAEVVNLIDIRKNTTWEFLGAVQASGAPLSIFVDQCSHDLDLLEFICKHALPAQRVQPVETFTKFCIKLVIGVLERINISSDMERILPFVHYALANRDHDEVSHLSSLTKQTHIGKLAEALMGHYDELMPWLLDCSCTDEMSKTVCFLILLQSSMVEKPDFARLFDASCELLRREGKVLELAGNAEKLKLRTADGDCRTFLQRLEIISGDELNAEILICLCRRLVEGFVITLPDDDISETWSCKLQSLFAFFVTRKSEVFKEQFQDLVVKGKSSLLGFLSKMLTEEGFGGQVQAESLRYFKHLCSLAEADEDLPIQLLNEFPSLLVPLASDDQDVRHAAMDCSEELHKLWTRINPPGSITGNSVARHPILGEMLQLLNQRKRLILSASDCLPYFFESFLSYYSTQSEKFDMSMKDEILSFLLSPAHKISASAKLRILSLLKGLGNRVTEVSSIKLLLHDLLQRRQKYHIMHDETTQKLCPTDIDILSLLLQICAKATLETDEDFFEYLLMALKVNKSEDPAVVKPCITVLEHIEIARFLSPEKYNLHSNKKQEKLIRYLVVLLQIDTWRIRNLADDLLRRPGTSINCRLVAEMLGSVGHRLSSLSNSYPNKHRFDDLYFDLFETDAEAISFLNCLLQFLKLKRDWDDRSFLIGPLNELYRLVFVNDERDRHMMDYGSLVCAPLSILRDIFLKCNISEESAIIEQLDVRLFIKCACLSSNIFMNVISFFSALVKPFPYQFLDHILDFIKGFVQSPANNKWNGFSKISLEKILSFVVPILKRNADKERLLQIFVDALPTQHFMRCLFRNHGQSLSFGSFLLLLLKSAALKESIAESDLFVNLKSAIQSQLEYKFAMELSAQCPCLIWLPSLVAFLESLVSASWNKDHFLQLTVAMQFVLEKLHKIEILLKPESGKDAEAIQTTLEELLKQTVYLLQRDNTREIDAVVSSNLREGQRELMHNVMQSIVKSLGPVSYFGVGVQLLKHTDKNVTEEALGLLHETSKEGGAINKIQRRGYGKGLSSTWVRFDENAKKSLNNMCLEILNLIDDSGGYTIKLAFVTLEALVNRFSPTLDESVLLACLKSASKNIRSNDDSVSSACLRATGALIHVLDLEALPRLPGIMKDISLLHLEDNNNHDGSVSVSSRTACASIVMPVLVCLEAVVDKLGRFLRTYLTSLLKLLVLRPCDAATTDNKIKSRADQLRKLMTDKIPVHILLPALTNIYSDAVKSGVPSVSITFEMLGNIVHSMDVSAAAAAYHVQSFDLGSLAVDLRGMHIDSINSILTDIKLKHLFETSIEWSVSCMGGGEEGKNIDRSLSFYGLVDELVKTHRSLFVPLFKYLLDGCVHHLREDAQVNLPPKKKKLKTCGVSLRLWRLRALITSSLQKCFMYDTGSQKFLDSSKFEVLLKPLVSQLVADPPASLEQHPEAPSTEKADDTLVACIGQMAVTAGSDLWRQLNDEVLKQARSPKVRARLLGLRIVKYLVENLKEEYLVLCPETIPFLRELLQDAEFQVQTMAHEILLNPLIRRVTKVGPAQSKC